MSPAQVQSGQERIYSNHSYRNLLDFLGDRYGAEIRQRVILKAGVDESDLTDPEGYQSREFRDRLESAAAQATGEPDIMYLAGRHILDNPGEFGKGFLNGLSEPAYFYEQMNALEGRIALKTRVRTERRGRHHLRLTVTHADRYREPYGACRNRIGAYEAIPGILGLPFAKVDHEQCVFRGDKNCVYDVTLPDSSFRHFLRLSLILGLLAVATGTTAALLPGVLTIAATVVFALTALLSLSIYKVLHHRCITTWSREANQQRMEQNRRLEENGKRIHALQELTQLLGQSISSREISRETASYLVDGFKFELAQVWLLEEDGSHIRRLGSASMNPSGLYRESTPTALAKNFGESADEALPMIRTRETGLSELIASRQVLLFGNNWNAVGALPPALLKATGAGSFSHCLVAPLQDANARLGILIVARNQMTAFAESEKLLLEAVSNSVGKTLLKARLFESMEETIARRTQELEETQLAFFQEQEKAIQAEKLSALGKMAAGIIHEINNPLNFLTNIIPDLRSDLEALARIRTFGKQNLTDEQILAEIGKLTEEADLEMHEEEWSYVFGRIQKALEKVTRIANSLKVFSKKSPVRERRKERLAGLVHETIAGIPKEELGSVSIEIDVPVEYEASVNRDEFEQVCQNLIQNAVDAMDKKGRINICAEKRGADYVISFKDDGPGIPAEVMKKIFDPFFTTKPAGKSTGLGLSICAELVRKNDGTLEVRSEPGKGAEFVLRLKAAR